MRVLVAVSLFHPHAGGAETQALRLAREFVKKGHEVTVVTRAFKGLAHDEEIDRVKVVRAIRVVDRGIACGLTYLISLFVCLLRRGREYDIVLTPLLGLDTFAAVLARRFTGTPVVARLACGGAYSDIARVRTMKGGKILLDCMKHVDGIIAISPQIVRELEEARFDARRIVRISNGVDTIAFAPASSSTRQRERLGIGAGAFVVFFMGRLAEQKGIRYLLQAWAVARERIDNAVLILAGEGEDRDELETIVSRLGIADGVRFVGKIADATVYLAAADLFVLPSLAEGMSNALLEAMASGLPCIASSNGSNEALIEDMKNGLLVPPKDSDALARAIGALATDSELAKRLGQAARERVVQLYDLKVAAARHLAFYDEVVRAKTKRYPKTAASTQQSPSG